MLRAVLAAVAALAVAACATVPRGGNPETARLFSALGRCGVDTRAGLLVHDPPGALLTMTTPQPLSALATGCMAGVLLDRGIDLKAADPLFALRYAKAWEAANAGVGPKMARLWLRRNVSGRVPRFRPGREALPDYVRKLETLCGAPPGSIAAEAMTLSVPWLEGAANEPVSCVYLAALASNLAASGVTIEAARAP